MADSKGWPWRWQVGVSLASLISGWQCHFVFVVLLLAACAEVGVAFWPAVVKLWSCVLFPGILETWISPLIFISVVELSILGGCISTEGGISREGGTCLYTLTGREISTCHQGSGQKEVQYSKHWSYCSSSLFYILVCSCSRAQNFNNQPQKSRVSVFTTKVRSKAPCILQAVT